ncbi:hypothetical protein BN1110_03002 [bacterium YEK0313]|nr:hypothetical protein BN1110_03002 [bacterium YEK0313]
MGPVGVSRSAAEDAGALPRHFLCLQMGKGGRPNRPLR